MRKVYYELNGKKKIANLDKTGAITSDAVIVWDEMYSGPAPDNVVSQFLGEKESEEQARETKRLEKEARVKRLGKAGEAKNIAELKAALVDLLEHLGIEKE